jgi:prepilin-type N-terminal cleavage/methylation domain-containing protein
MNGTLSVGLSARRGLTLVETLISVTIFALASGIVFSGMVFMARQQAATVSQQRIENNARRLMTALAVETADATGMSVEVATPQNRQRLIINKPGRQVAYQYTNGDGNDNTIADNRISRAEAATGVALPAFTPVLDWVSPIGTNRVFALDTQTSATRPLVNVLMRVGDRSTDRASTQRRADDALTGPGYQSFLIDTAYSKGDRISP